LKTIKLIEICSVKSEKEECRTIKVKFKSSQLSQDFTSSNTLTCINSSSNNLHFTWDWFNSLFY